MWGWWSGCVWKVQGRGMKPCLCSLSPAQSLNGFKCLLRRQKSIVLSACAAPLGKEKVMHHPFLSLFPGVRWDIVNYSWLGLPENVEGARLCLSYCTAGVDRSPDPIIINLWRPLPPEDLRVADISHSKNNKSDNTTLHMDNITDPQMFLEHFW